MTANSSNKINGSSRKPVKLIGVAVVIGVVVFAAIWLKVVQGSEDSTSGMATFVAKRGPLTISVLESGAIKAKEQEVIRNEVEGRTSIIWIVPEGTRVKKGDLLVELDASKMDDERIDQEIRVQNGEAAFINAQETLAITENQAKSDIELAELNLKFAEQDLAKYLEGQYPNELIAAQNKVQEANEVLTRAKETLRWSETLFGEKYISETELLADRLAETKGKNNLTVAQNDLRLLQEYTRQRQVDQLTSDVNQAKMALERTNRKASANVVQARAELNAKEQEYKRQVAKLDKIADQMAKARIVSPADGMVVYATSSRGGFRRDDLRPLADGVEVFERQELIYIPKSASSVAEVDVHEASLDKVRLGLPAIVKVDALPDKTFVGTVSRIAPLPNAQSMWMNPDLKVYTTNIDLDSDDPVLRSGMSCKAEIIVEQHKGVVYVPVQSVLRVRGKPTVFVVKDGQTEERKVEIGLDNNSMVIVKSGLSESEVVLMTPPLKAAAIEPGVHVPGADANDPMAQKIKEKLEAANELGVDAAPAVGTQRSVEGPAEGGFGRGPQGGQGFQTPSADQMRRFQNMTPEERQKMFEQAVQNMTPEQREQAEQMRQRFQNMSDEERQQMRQRMGGSRGEGSGPGATGRRQGGRRGGAGTDSAQPSEGGQ